MKFASAVDEAWSAQHAQGDRGQRAGEIRGLVEFGPVAQPVVELSGGDGSGHEVALGLVAAQAGQLGVSAGGFDAFGDHAQAEAVGQVDGGGDQGEGAGVVGHGDDEGAVELQLVDGQVAQVAQGAVTGAIVVYGDLDAAVPQLGQDRPGPISVGQQELLGDLQLQGLRRDSPGGEHRGDLARQVGVDQ